jgi:hypothetical protein
VGNKKNVEGKIKVYEVSFTWKGYSDYSEGAKAITINVVAEDKFKATAKAWEIAKRVDPTEPERFNVETQYAEAE